MNFNEFEQEYGKLCGVEDTEETPYKSKYAARMLAERQLAKETNVWSKFRVKVLLGKNYLATDQPADADITFKEALTLWTQIDSSERQYEAVADLLLQLSSLNIQRMKLIEALPWAVFARHISMTNSLTMDILSNFHLARIFGGLGWRETSAFYCARTLADQWTHNAGLTENQKAVDYFNSSEYVSNLTDLAVFFVNQGNMWTAEYLLQGALAAAELTASNPIELVAKCQRDLSRFYRSRLEFTRHVTQTAENETLTLWQKITNDPIIPASIGPDFRLPVDISDSVIPMSISIESVTDNKVQETESLEPFLMQPSPDLIIFQAPGQSRQLSIRPAVRLADEVHERATARLLKVNFPVVERFLKSELCTFSACGSRDILTKREIFKVGLHFANQAMVFFKLDGWATDHLSVVQELSHLWRELAAAEAEAGESKKRLISMLERRYVLLDGVVFQINAQVFPDFHKSFLYELGDICTELFDLKDNDEDVGHNAIRYYELFVEAFGGKGPVDFDLRAVVTAKLSAARLLMKLRGAKLDDQLSYNRKACELCDQVLLLTKEHSELKDAPETRLAKELVALLPGKIAKLGLN